MRWTRRFGLAGAVAFATIDALLALQAGAVPRYSARYEQKCALCHVNPSGGGLRSAYASQDLVPRELAWSKARPELLAGIDPLIAKNILIGTDFRELYVGSDDPAGRLGFFQMQGDLYFDFQLDPKVSLYYDRGAANSIELFGLVYPLPVAYVKAGRFVPSYGWKFDDHTMFVRSELGFFPPGNSDVGVEVGASPQRFDVQLGVVNGNRGAILDNDRRVATVANGIYRLHVGPLGAAAGVSGYHHPGTLEDFDSGGVYGYLIWRNLTWLGEADLFRTRPAAATATEGVVTSHELTCLLRQGLELKATYDFYDPDRDHATGAKSRWGGGVAVMPHSYLALEGMLRRTRFENGISYFGRDAYETVLQLHLLY